ncbi:MAG: hypothetical protein CMJ64_28545 [Planctomycetaceae bacterium]|nr:hypothetical protein [Planctomycetaceae bacterium]
MLMRTVTQTSILIICLSSTIASAPAAEEPSTDFFEKRVGPIFVERCYECHGSDESNGGLRLDSRGGWQAGGETGPPIVPGKPEQSLLIKAIRYTDKKLQMPPDDGGGKLPDTEIEILTKWVRSGAADPRTSQPATVRDTNAAKSHWAFQPIRRPDVPADKHPVDFFIDRALIAKGVVATPRADQRTLVRRALFDLHGLPPNEEQLATNVDQFDKLIDGLLDSPRYGERWGRHWLDVARYADTKDGVLMYGDNRIRPFAYTYRDYVISAFNDDKPFDRFIHEQLAADQLGLPEGAPELAAMGFLTLGRMFDNNRHDVIDDQIDTVTRGFLGLTASCARCHDHKFDPIPTDDYYSLYGVFASCIEPFDRPRIATPTKEGEAFEQELAKKTAELQKMQAEQHELLLAAARGKTTEYLVKVATTEPDVSETAIFFLSLLPDQLRPQIVNRWRKLIERRSNSDDLVFAPWHDFMQEHTLKAELWRERGIDERVVTALTDADPTTPAGIATVYGELLTRAAKDDSLGEDDPLRHLLLGRDSPVWFSKSQVWYYMSRHDKDKYRGMVNGLYASAVKSPHASPRAMILQDSEELYAPAIFRRGDPTQPGALVPRQFLRVASPAERKPFSNGSGRLDLAKAITSPDNPLTARVHVNRMWMHHFGEPLVENLDDFGLRTPPPTHPELLDFLASELIRNGWKVKPLHRLIMTAAAWQRSSQLGSDEPMAKQHREDPQNRWLWRANRRRLDLETMRDAVLAVSGQLDLTMYGRPAPIIDVGNVRRTVYAIVERQTIPDVVRNFDFASPDSSVGRRNVTTVPQQALFVMNSAFVTRAAKALADHTNGEPAERIASLHQAVLGRVPTANDMTVGLQFIGEASWHEYAQVLLMTNELMFID